MTITGLTEVWSGQTADDEESGAKSYSSLYRVYTDDPSESMITVKAVLPAIGAQYPGDTKAVVKSRSVTRSSETREVFEATVSYEYDPDDPDEPQENPLDEPAKIRWSSSLEIEPVFKDRAGKAIVNSAGDYFDPPVEFPIAKWQVNVQKNVSYVPPQLLSWAGAINSESYSIGGVEVEAKKSRLVALEISDRQEKNDVEFYTVTMGIEFSKDEYLITPLDQGFRFKDSDDVLKDILIVDEDGGEQRPSAPVLLDGAGGVLADPDTDNAVFLEFDPPVPEINFNELPLS